MISDEWRGYSLKIFVTGADGFIGSHLVEKLVSTGYEVKAFCLYNSRGSYGWLDDSSSLISNNIEVILGDVRDELMVRESMKNCDVVIHLAALIGIPYSYQAIESYIDTNVKGTLNVLKSALFHSVKTLIHTSTSEVYGSAKEVPINESHPILGQSPYSASKIAADQLAYSFYSSFGLPVTTIRPFNTYGPRQSSRAIIPTVITQILNGKRVKLGYLDSSRDFTYVEDTVNAFLSAIKCPEAIGQTINLGSNFEIKIGDLVTLIAELMNQKIDIEVEKKRIRPSLSEVDRLCSDNSQAKRILNWQPINEGYGGLKYGLLKTIEWFKDKNNRAFYKGDTYQR